MITPRLPSRALIFTNSRVRYDGGTALLSLSPEPSTTVMPVVSMPYGASPCSTAALMAPNVLPVPALIATRRASISATVLSETTSALSMSCATVGDATCPSCAAPAGAVPRSITEMPPSSEANASPARPIGSPLRHDVFAPGSSRSPSTWRAVMLDM